MKDLIKRRAICSRASCWTVPKRYIQRTIYYTLGRSGHSVEKWDGSQEAIAAAWPHDTVEDCPPTSFQEITGIFGSNVSDIVRTYDDKSLPKQRRKDLQIFKAPKHPWQHWSNLQTNLQTSWQSPSHHPEDGHYKGGSSILNGRRL